MNDLSTPCPCCRSSLEIRPDFENVVCLRCGTAYWVRRHGGALNLAEIGLDEETRGGIGTETLIEQRLADIDELIAETESEIEALKSREQSAPLQMGCAFFGLFMTIMVVSAVFMLLGKGYFGSWMFYVLIAAVILLGVARIKRKLIGPVQREKLRHDRIEAEGDLAKLELERNRIQELKARLNLE